MGVFQNNLMGAAAAAASAGGGDFYTYQIPYSARFDGSTSTIIKTWGAAPTSTTKKTISVWLKRSLVGNATAQRIITAGEGSTGTYYFNQGTDDIAYYAGAAYTNGYTTTKVFRDPSAWFHFVAIFDSGQSNDYDRIKFYFNGELFALNNGGWTFNSGYPNTSVPLLGANGITNYISRYVTDDTQFNGYMADFIQIDGTAAISDFGETKNGVWIPKDPSGLTFGNNGYWLDFASSGDFGNDVSGNNNDWTAAGLAAHDQMLDTPTFSATDGNGGNFCTYNGAWLGTGGNTLSEGNLASGGSGGGTNSGTFGMLTGKWYWECRAETVASYGPTFGIGQSGAGQGTNGQNYIITWQTAAGVMFSGGAPTGMGTISVTSTGVTALSSGDILSFWLDCDNRKLWVGKNGTIPNSGAPASGTNPQASWTTNPTSRYFTAICENVSSVGVLNAGQNPSFNGALTGGDVGTATDKNGYGLFKYDPSGTDFVACCAANIPTAAEVDPAQTDDDYPQKLFNTKLYTGTGSSLALTGVGFQPDFVWGKDLGALGSTYNHMWFDTNRGVTKHISSDRNNAEYTTAASLTSFNADGFTYGSDLSMNTINASVVAWNWRANGGTTSSGSGDLTSTHQVDPSGCFSIVKYIGNQVSNQTWSHGLSVKPDFIMLKGYSQTTSWVTYHSSLGATKFMYLNTNAAVQTGSHIWYNTEPTTSVVRVDNNNATNYNSGATYIAYVFANCEGYIKAGSYEGNGNVDGTFVYTGFRPAWIMTKSVDSTSNWQVFDDKRVGYNVDNNELQADTTAAETTTDMIDILSNGFKLRIATDPNVAETYVYLALAHNPFQYATAR